ncbi:MAG: peptide synthetase [Mycetocola sp.]
MRLTNVAQMQLPSGRLHSYGTVVTGARGPELPISFDQRRHVSAGDRPGSWMAVTFRLPHGTGLDRLGRAWLAVIARHGSLHSVFSVTATPTAPPSAPAGTLQLHSVTVTGTGWREEPLAPDQLSRDALRLLLDRECTPLSAPAHRLSVLTPDPAEPDQRPVAIIASDHAHVDMWSMLVLARDLVQALSLPDTNTNTNTPDQPGAPTAPPEGGAVLPPVAAFSEHTAALELMPPAPQQVTERWRDILAAGGGFMPRFPLPLGDISEPRAEVVEVHDVLDGVATARFEAVAAAAGVRPIALALSGMTEVTNRLSGRPLRAVFPVHSRTEPRWREAVGWFITNAVIECADPAPAECARSVSEALRLGSHPLAPIFAPYGGMPEAPGMFALSWLDGRRLPTGADTPELASVSAVIRTDGVMVWFIVNTDGLHLRCRYPDTPEARTSLRRWLDEVIVQFRRAAEPLAS